MQLIQVPTVYAQITFLKPPPKHLTEEARIPHVCREVHTCSVIASWKGLDCGSSDGGGGELGLES